MQRYDEFDDQNEEGAFSRMMSLFERRGSAEPRRPFFAAAIVTLLVLILAGVIWIGYPRGNKGGDEAVPIVRADTSPVKTAPDSEGGMEIPYRESTVYDSMRGDDGSKVENLLPRTEEPVDRNQVFAGLKAELHGQPAPQDQAQSQASAATPADISESSAVDAPQEVTPAPEALPPAASLAGSRPPASVAAAVPAPAVQPEAAPAAAVSAPAVAPAAPTQISAAPSQAVPVTPASPPPAPEKQAAVAEKAVKAAKVEPASGDAAYKPNGAATHYVQLASIKDKAAASGAWKSLQKQFPGLLDSQKYRVQEASVKGGTFYRVQAGPLDESSARSLCKSIGAKKPGSCIVVSR